jgi:hypothetical protein
MKRQRPKQNNYEAQKLPQVIVAFSISLEYVEVTVIYKGLIYITLLFNFLLSLLFSNYVSVIPCYKTRVLFEETSKKIEKNVG